MRRRTILLLLVAIVAALIGGAFRFSAPAPLPAGDANRAPANEPMMTAAADERNTALAGAAVRGSPGRLFTYVQAPNARALDAALPAPSQKIHYVRIDSALATAKSSPFWRKAGEGRVVLPLPDGGVVVVTIAGSEMLGADRFVSRGQIEGRPGSRAAFAWNDGFLHATIEDPELGTFVLRTATTELAQFYQVDPSLIAPCGGERRPTIDSAAVAVRSERARARSLDDSSHPPGAPGPAVAAENPQRSEVHVLMLHTPAVLTTMSGPARTAALQSAFDLAIERVNTALSASFVSARMKLVRVAETAYAKDPTDNSGVISNLQDTALTALYRQDDGEMDEIHALRDQVGADVVCLALNGRDAVSSGLSFLLDEPGEASNALFAFAIVDYGNIAGSNVVAHEMGHLFGCAHDRENATSGPGAYSFSYGYRFYGADGVRYRDIMAYPPGRQLAYYSSPLINLPAPVSAALGIAAGNPGESDGARTIEDNAFAVAQYRLQTQAAVNAGTLVNVATRAFVGSDDQVLIGGFVVGGTEPKGMLLRAVGPALAAFGVTDPLTNPRLRLFRRGDLVAENDNWSEPSAGSAGEVSAAATAAGAFAFAPGSADAALLVSLPPGDYTAVVEGVGGSRGSGLVEAYETSRGGGRIINLATRGYADNTGREMLGGFVVAAAPGTTKRILVRVLGPTLGREPYNVAGALFDPFLELRGSDGRLLLANDDWSSGARTVNSTRDDFQPLVRYYDERRIAATGFAPGNRREPCILVDLPPGNFTVVVKPFERLDPDPELNQPAEPGVGIVEVYEVNQ